MRVRRLTTAALLVVSVASGACDDTASNATSSARVQGRGSMLYDSLRIAEGQEVFVANPLSLLAVPIQRGLEGTELIVADAGTGSYLQFDGRGHFVSRTGRPGDGPGEFRLLGQVFLDGPSEIGAVEISSRQVKWFDRNSGQVLRVSRYGTGTIGLSEPVQTANSDLIFPLLDLGSRTSIGVFRKRTGTWERAGPFPQAYTRSVDQGRGAFAAYFRYLAIARNDDSTFVLGFAGVDSLFIVDERSLAVLSARAVPRLRRRGLEGECRFSGDAPDPARAFRECGLVRDRFSPITGIWQVREGLVAVLHTELTTVGEPPRVLLRGRSFLSLIDTRTGSGCIDLPVPGGSEVRAVHDLKERMLYILDRRVTDTTSALWLLKARVPDMHDCDLTGRVGF